MKATGIVLIIIGLLLTIFNAGKFFTKEKVAEVGKVQITTEKPHYLSWPPVAGVIILSIGAVVLWQSSKK